MNAPTLTLRATVLAVAMAGVLLGMFVPKAGHGLSYSVNTKVFPGGGSDFQCGWHSGPCYDNDSLVATGWGLDFAPNSTVSFKSQSLTDSPMFAVSGRGTVAVGAQTACSHMTSVNVYDNSATWRAGVVYLHASNSVSNGTTFDINAGYLSFASTTRAIGATASESGCGSSWTGYHVHQETGGGWGKVNYPDHTSCNKPTITSGCSLGSGSAMFDAWWTLSV